ncbi:MAG: hypothetical protein HON70_06355 [Lentisphaerae bacterium]|nr:hypothetical protein [Lentisphaerota bacterium]
MFKADISLRDLDAALGRFVDRLEDPRPFLTVWGQRTAKQARTTARGKGGRHFWGDMARSVQVGAVSADTMSVHTKHVAAAQKQFGGVIEAKKAKALTIPISDEAKGKRASEFESGGRDLFVLETDGSDPDLIGLLGYSEDDEFHALFVLRKRTRRQDPDPWWPETAQVGLFGLQEAATFVQRALDTI